MNRLHPLAASLVLTALIATFAACSSTKPGTADITGDFSGFLKDYSALRSGGEGGPLYAFRATGADLASYRRVLLAPIEVWRGKESREAGLDTETIQLLADCLYTVIDLRLSRDYEMVDSPSDFDTMRIRVGITKLGEEDMKLEALSSTTPHPDLKNAVRDLAGKIEPSFVGRASIEVEVKDAQTSALMFAAIERKTGEALTGSAEDWVILEREFELIAERIGYLFCRERDDEDCVRPQ